MASSRHLLLYADGNTASDGNFTFDGSLALDCIANCVGTCIYSLCFPSPPLSPTSSPHDAASGEGTTIPINRHRHDRLLPTLIIAVAVSSLLLLSIYAYLHYRRRRHLSTAAVTDAGAVSYDYDGGSEVEHHIWYIRTPGLDESTIASIAAWVYKSGDGLVDGKDCSVCLGQFRDGELVRLLPNCSHAFHLPCIDRWLRSHVSCPLCRSSVVSPATASVTAPSPGSPSIVVATDTAELETGSSATYAQVEAFPRESNR